MRIEKEYMPLEDIDEIRIFNATKKDFYKPTPKEFDIEDIFIQELMDNLPVEIHAFIPHEDGKDFIIQRIGNFTLERYSCAQEDAKGRLLSKLSPLFYDVLHDYLIDAYKNHNTKKIRFAYYNKNKLMKLSNAKIVYDMGKIFIATTNIDTDISSRIDVDERTFDEDKTNMMESFSQTGSYYNLNGKYTWSQGIYNIINRAKEEADDYYNIVFDLVVPEDKHIVDKIFNIAKKETTQCEEIIRIRDTNNVLKVIEVNVYSYLDENDLVIYQGLINDVTQHNSDNITNPVDFLLDGFKNSDKIALLIEPLNEKHFKASKGFYHLLEEDDGTSPNTNNFIKNIADKETIEQIHKIANGKLSKINETFAYKVNGNANNEKIFNLYVERFEYNNDVHSLGFLTDITDEMGKQTELIESNAQKLVLLKEIHHRVKNNLQVLNSFLNLEKRAYKNDPNLIIEHMQTRLISLALIHEKTYKAQNFKEINLREYMIDYDMQTKNLVNMPVEIKFETHVDEDLNLTLEVITPLLLIIDELTMNTIKHAFPDKSAPNKKITKKITKLNEDTAQLIIQDNGIGIKDSENIRKNLGCEIIKSLTNQLGGNISLIEHEKGTTYKIIFPIEMEHTINRN